MRPLCGSRGKNIGHLQGSQGENIGRLQGSNTKQFYLQDALKADFRARRMEDGGLGRM